MKTIFFTNFLRQILAVLFLTMLFLSPISAALYDTGGGSVVIIDDAGCFALSPNPTTDDDIMTIKAAELAIVESIIVRTIDGGLVFSQSCSSNTCEVDFSTLAEGTYLIYFKTSTCEVSGLLIVR